MASGGEEGVASRVVNGVGSAGAEGVRGPCTGFGRRTSTHPYVFELELTYNEKCRKYKFEEIKNANNKKQCLEMKT